MNGAVVVGTVEGQPWPGCLFLTVEGEEYSFFFYIAFVRGAFFPELFFYISSYAFVDCSVFFRKVIVVIVVFVKVIHDSGDYGDGEGQLVFVCIY